jgi:hypothetical protein
MARSLVIVAGAGIAVSAVCLGLAAAVAGDDFGDLHIGGLGSLFHACDDSSAGGFTGNTREIAWEDEGDDVTINVPATVTYRPGTGTTLIASGDPRALSHLRVTDEGEIEFDCRGLDVDELTLTLPGRPFSDFAMNGSGTLVLENLSQRELDIAVRGSGRILAGGTADEVDVEIAGSGEAEFNGIVARQIEIAIFGSGEVLGTGTADTLEVSIAGSGDATLGGLNVGRVEVNIAGSGDATVAPRDQAEVNIAGSGDVSFVTQPQRLETNIAGSGKIVHAPATPAPAPVSAPVPAPAP